MAGLIEKARQLPADLKTLFFGDDPMIAGEEACFLYGFPEEKISAVTLPLGAIFVGDMKLGDYPSDIAAKAGVDEATACGIAFEVNKRIFLKFPEHFKDAEALQRDWEKKKKPPVMSEEEAKKKVFELEPWLLEKDEDAVAQENAVQESHVKLSLLAALGKYARLGEQAITSSRLTLKGNPEPVRGNLVNWLKVYRDELGVGYHDPVLRAKFLFNSPNAKNISSEERERLNLILRSVEENAPLDIDLSKMEIVFPSFTVTEPKAPPTLVSKESSGQTPMRSVPASVPVPSVPLPTPGVQPAPAPKRQGMFSSAFTTRPTGSGSPAPSGSGNTAPEAPAGQGGFRVGKGMHFTSLEPKSSAPVAPSAVPAPVVPQPPTQSQPVGGGFSFSSKHAFPSEHTEEGGLSINRSSGETLPSGQAFFKGSGTAPASAAPSVPKPAKPAMSPFQIRPVSLHGKSGDEDMGRIVDLRNEG
ncbi:MAG: hypothetical protein KBD19_03690 [Candidatus Moranbacteria bacterium]|nr:hypothetical protein [Candidatus Moranbacteria bacterium]